MKDSLVRVPVPKYSKEPGEATKLPSRSLMQNSWTFVSSSLKFPSWGMFFCFVSVTLNQFFLLTLFDFHSLMRHKNIIRLHGAIAKYPNFVIVTELFECGSLYEILHGQDVLMVSTQKKSNSN